jgi:hypothetical protein
MDDTIYRQEAIKAFCERCGNLGEPCDGCNDIPLLYSLPSAQQWIPCSERLPEPNRSVLVQLRVDYADPIQIMTLNISKCEGGVSCIWKTQEMSIYFDMEDVVAWMPLPEPYKGDDDK